MEAPIEWTIDQVDRYEELYPEMYIIEPKERDCEE